MRDSNWTYDPSTEHPIPHDGPDRDRAAPRWRRLLGFLRLAPRSARPLQDEAQIVDLLFGLARRHGGDFSVVVAEVRRSRGHTADSKRDFELAVDRALRDAIRSSDRVVVDGAGHYVIHCPYTGKVGALQFAERIRKCMSVVPDCLATTGQASFPEDALTLEGIVDIASSAIEKEHRAHERGDGGTGPGPTHSHSSKDRVASSIESLTLKRVVDLVLVIGAAPLYLPVMGLICLALLWAEPRSPVIFRQVRTGRGGRRFPMFKFRTMVPEAEELKSEVAHLNELSWPDFKISKDPRITPFGRILRRTSLDELPQVFNVIRGEMSLVGPRPTSFAPDRYELWHTERLDAPPGMTGLWQVERRNTTDFDDRLRLDIAYIRTRRPWTDPILLARTLWAVAVGRGVR